jgi:predicted dehydrogenase
VPHARVRLGLIGCGAIAELGHVPTLLRAGASTVVATADVSASRARHLGAQAGIADEDCVADYRRLLERSDVDAVSVATPPSTHREVVEAAAGAGKHVICEKPLALTLADADAMIEVCRRAGVTLAVYHNYLYHPETVLARKIVDEGSIGEPLATEISGLGARPSRGVDEFRPDWRWTVSDAGGGALMDIGVHAFYLTETYHRRRATSVLASVRYGETGVDVQAFCQLRLGDGVGLVNVAWGHGNAALTVLGTEGSLSFVYDEGNGYFGSPARGVRVKSFGRPATTHYLPPDRVWFQPDIYADFAAAIEGSGSYPALGEDGRRMLEIAHAAYKSAVDWAPVALPLATSEEVYSAGVAAVLSEVAGAV